jgi:carboxymethylenebutenolidase
MRKILVGLLVLGLAAVVPAQDPVKQRLEKSPRHHKWVDVKQGDRKVACFVVFPEVKGKATAVVVIHENKGLTDWVRGVADQLAEAGYIAIAPDLLSGMGPGGGNTDAFKSSDQATRAIGQLKGKQQQVTADLKAVADYAAKLPACNGRVAACGFCWGGGQVFRFATNYPDLKAAFVFYGAFPHTKEDLERIKCPVYGFYGENDNRINATIPKSKEQMKAAGKTFEPVIYDGAGHGFMRSGEEAASGDNRKARNAAWERWKKLLKKI